MAGDKAMVVTKGLTKVYGDGASVRALDGVSLRVDSGEFLAVCGPSGSGKTTLLNLIGTLDRPTSGEVWVNGVNVARLKGDALADFRRENIGFVFQLFHLVPWLTALENVMLPLLPYRRGLGFDLEDRARGLLEEMGLGGRLEHLPGELSGGEQQRVAIARALVNRPRLVLADEPTGNLDSASGSEVMELLRRSNESHGVTVVLVTHDERVAGYADRVIHLQDGKIVG